MKRREWRSVWGGRKRERERGREREREGERGRERERERESARMHAEERVREKALVFSVHLTILLASLGISLPTLCGSAEAVRLAASFLYHESDLGSQTQRNTHSASLHGLINVHVTPAAPVTSFPGIDIQILNFLN